MDPILIHGPQAGNVPVSSSFHLHHGSHGHSWPISMQGILGVRVPMTSEPFHPHGAFRICWDLSACRGWKLLGHGRVFLWSQHPRNYKLVMMVNDIWGHGTFHIAPTRRPAGRPDARCQNGVDLRRHGAATPGLGMGCVHGCGQSLQSLSLREFLKGTSPNVSIMYTNIITHMDSWFIPPITRVNLGMVYRYYVFTNMIFNDKILNDFLQIELKWDALWSSKLLWENNESSFCYNLWSCEWRIGPHVLQRISAE